jgi:hypothetical protein
MDQSYTSNNSNVSIAAGLNVTYGSTRVAEPKPEPPKQVSTNTNNVSFIERASFIFSETDNFSRQGGQGPQLSNVSSP